MQQQIIKGPSFMTKRSQMKSRFKTISFKQRWFILTRDYLSYHDGSVEQSPGKEKGRVFLKDIVCVENTDHDHLGGRANAFQIRHKPAGTDDHMSLYIMAVFPEERQQWIDAIVKACTELRVSFVDKFHPGVWNFKTSQWSCCDKRLKFSEACTDCQNKTNLSIANGNQERSAAPLPSRRPDLPPTTNQKKVVALYPYNPVNDGDLKLETGEEYTIVDDSKPHWWKARNAKGEEGFVPSNFVETLKEDGLEKYAWYYKGVSRPESEAILRNENNPGCFLVRDSSQRGMYTLSLFTQEIKDGMTRHYHIKKNSEGKFYLSEKHAFDNIPDIVHYHKHNAGGLVVRLRHPPKDRMENIPATVGMGKDRYELDPADIVMGDLLGSGQFGTVKKAKYKGVKDVAVKEMLTGSMREDDFIEEARTMMNFQHKNLVQLYGVCTKTRPIFIVLEYMSNGALLQFLRRRKVTLLRTPDTLTYMCKQICEAMKYLESQQCIHRDLAARNCLVGEKDLIKVGDFGLARYVLDDEYTSSNGTKFPVKWAPPEVLGYTKFSSKSDVWAFGITMWEIWTGGDMPYGRMRNTEVVEKVCNHNYRLSKPSDCPTPIYDIMRACWKAEPEQRPPFSEIVESLLALDNYQD